MGEPKATPRVAGGAVLVALIVAAYFGWLATVPAHVDIRAIVFDSDTLMVVVAAVAAFTSAVTAWVTRGRVRAAWASMTVGLTGFTLGAAIWRYYEVSGVTPPYPSVADIAYLLLPIATGTSLVLLASGMNRTSRTRLMLDGLTVAASFTIVIWIVVLNEIMRLDIPNRFKIAVSLTYPVLDAAVLTIGLLVLARALPGQRRTLVLLTLAMTCVAVSDDVFVYLAATQRHESVGWIDYGWLAGLVLMTAAAIAGRDFNVRETIVAQPPSVASVWLPFVPVAAAALIALMAPPEVARELPILVPSIVLVVAFLARQLLTMSENRRLLVEVAEQALRDPLTGVGNRIVLRDHLNHAMQMRERDGLTVGVLAMDLDDFKVVNDTLGHPVGDELLNLVAERILGCVRDGDTVARLGGDEFAVLLEGRDDHTQLIAHRVVEAFDRPFHIVGQELLVRPSVGLAVAEADDPDVTAMELLKRADIAMYAAKRSRTGGVHTYNAEMLLAESPGSDLFDKPSSETQGRGAESVRLLGELRQAIDHFELTLVYQPKFDLRTGSIVGAEALVRWPHPVRGVLAPDEFLPLVRRYGLMGRVNDFVVNKALDDVLEWRAAGVPIPIAINLFAPSMADLRLPDTISLALGNRDLEPSILTVEITEDLFLDNMERTKLVLARLRERGIRIAIDDFGSGYSALSYMRELTVDEVKLDRHFIAPMLDDPRAAAVVRAVIDLAAELGLATVAEGIENLPTANWLREHGCSVGQGFFLSPPVSSEKLVTLFRRCAVEGPGGYRDAVRSR
ncbi:bifunctional diguanylate cyclase/phosphodiesterase [Mycobacterium sp. DL592]|uniref:putative bifunctional diguanylate cyclase/phosphodiesterase n=1 Tax=Mycobacterium sp. DL592 TaxID=2675524 RepID=UPI001421095D|nr:bifunctional diguanylate cyclase/phosphodiesterase [Mycobacterium sp. DL592]